MGRIRYARAGNVAALTLGALSLLSVSGPASAIAISFNDFFHDPGAPIVVSADGSTAQFSESADTGVVFLSNVPGFGDPTLVVPQTGATLSFNYQFLEPADNDDQFHFALLDGNTGDVLSSAYEGFFADSASGTIQINLAPLVGLVLGLQFELAANPSDAGLDSTLVLSDLQIILPPPPPPPPPPPDDGDVAVPEPGTLSLFALAALTMLMGCMRRRSSRGI